jgi:hypothetical protein
MSTFSTLSDARFPDEPYFAVIATTSAVFFGCSRANDQETAALRSELKAANEKIAELKAEISRRPPDGPQKEESLPKPKARLLVVRGLRPNWVYAVYEGQNVLGRADDQPVDIDLQPQEPEDRIWSSRQHAAITAKGDVMVIEDLNSSNGTYVNRKRVPPGEKRPLHKDDVIQIGEVHIKVLE